MLPRLAPLAVLLVLDAPPAAAGPPLVTDDPAPAPRGVLEAIVALRMERRASATRYATPLLDLSYGLVEDLELSATLPWVVADESGGGSRSAVGNLSVGAKWRFLHQDETWLDVAVAPSLALDSSGSSVDRILGTGETVASIPVLVERQLGRWRVGGELGLALHSDGPAEWIFGAALGRQLAGGLLLLAETYGVSRSNFSAAEWAFSLGLDWEVQPRVHLLLAAGRGLHEHASERLKLRAFAGLQLIWD